MSTQLYVLREERNVLFTRLIGPQIAASRLALSLDVLLASLDDLQEHAARRKKLLYVSGLPLDSAVAAARERRIPYAVLEQAATG